MAGEHHNPKRKDPDLGKTEGPKGRGRNHREKLGSKISACRVGGQKIVALERKRGLQTAKPYKAKFQKDFTEGHKIGKSG